MKYIYMWLNADGTGKFKEQEQFDNENLATRLVVDYSAANAAGMSKWVDFVLADGTKMTLPLLENEEQGDILTIDMDDSLTVEGPLLIQPFATGPGGIKKVWDVARVIVHYSINNTGEVALENPDLIAQLFATKISSNGMNSNIDKLTFNVATADVSPLLEGELRWNAAERTLDIGVDGDGVVLQVGEESYYPRVKNIDTVDIPEGSLVEYTGSLGASGVLLIKRASTSLPLAGSAMGIATETIPKNKTGKVTWFGLVRNIQTNGANYGESWMDGDILYNSTAHAGGLSKVKPVAPKNALFVAIVVRSHATSGILFVRPLYFPRLEQLSNVFAPTPADQDVIYYNSSAGRWEGGKFASGMIAYGDGTVEEKLNGLTAVDIAAADYNETTYVKKEGMIIAAEFNRPNWSTQPTIVGGGALNAAFVDYKTDYYFMTLKDTAGNALPANQFKLTLTKSGHATAIDQIFLGATDWGSENTMVEFSEIGANWKIRYAFLSNAYNVVAIPMAYQNKDLMVIVEGGIEASNYFQVQFGGNYSHQNYKSYSSVGGGAYAGNMYFPPSSSIANTNKWVRTVIKLEIRQLDNSVFMDYIRTDHGGATRYGSHTFYNYAGAGEIISSNTITHPMKQPITEIRFKEEAYPFKNGTRIYIKELVR